MLTLVEGRRWRLARLGATSLLNGLVEAAFLVLITRIAFAITDDRSSFELVGDARASIATGIVAGLALAGAKVALAAWTSWQSAALSTEVIADIRRDLASAFLFAAWPVQEEERTGRLQELLTTFTAQGTTLITNLALAIASSLSLLALLATAVAVDPVGALVVIVSVGALGFVLRPLRSGVKRRARRSAATGMEFASSLSEVSQLGLEVHVFDVQPQARDQVFGLIAASQDAERRLAFARGLISPVYTGLAYLALVGALGIVELADTTNLTSLGSVMLIMLRSLSYGQGLQSASAAIAATAPFLQALQQELSRFQQARRDDGGQAVGEVGPVAFADVTFSYVPGRTVLRDLSFEIGAREVVGIVGPSGGGKSTLVQLLLGLREPDAGLITAAGRPIRGLSRREWARKVTFVPQEAHLISGTIADNIRFLRDDVTDDEVAQAARLAHLHDDVSSFEEGYAREVGPGGSRLSGGQRQRLCIARALVEDPDLLILDEPTAALDVRSEHLIQQTLRDLRARMAIVIIAHRLTTLDVCDRLMVIQDGELKAYDTPARLAEGNAFYHEALTLSGLR